MVMGWGVGQHGEIQYFPQLAQLVMHLAEHCWHDAVKSALQAAARGIKQGQNQTNTETHVAYITIMYAHMHKQIT